MAFRLALVWYTVLTLGASFRKVSTDGDGQRQVKFSLKFRPEELSSTAAAGGFSAGSSNFGQFRPSGLPSVNGESNSYGLVKVDPGAWSGDLGGLNPLSAANAHSVGWSGEFGGSNSFGPAGTDGGLSGGLAGLNSLGASNPNSGVWSPGLEGLNSFGTVGTDGGRLNAALTTTNVNTETWSGGTGRPNVFDVARPDAEALGGNLGPLGPPKVHTGIFNGELGYNSFGKPVTLPSSGDGGIHLLEAANANSGGWSGGLGGLNSFGTPYTDPGSLGGLKPLGATNVNVESWSGGIGRLNSLSGANTNPGVWGGSLGGSNFADAGSLDGGLGGYGGPVTNSIVLGRGVKGLNPYGINNAGALTGNLEVPGVTVDSLAPSPNLGGVGGYSGPIVNINPWTENFERFDPYNLRGNVGAPGFGLSSGTVSPLASSLSLNSYTSNINSGSGFDAITNPSVRPQAFDGSSTLGTVNSGPALGGSLGGDLSNSPYGGIAELRNTLSSGGYYTQQLPKRIRVEHTKNSKWSYL